MGHGSSSGGKKFRPRRRLRSFDRGPPPRATPFPYDGPINLAPDPRGYRSNNSAHVMMRSTVLVSTLLVVAAHADAQSCSLVADIYPGFPSNPTQLWAVPGEMLLFRARHPVVGTELFRADKNGVSLVADLLPGGPGFSSDPERFTSFFNGSRHLTVFSAKVRGLGGFHRRRALCHRWHHRRHKAAEGHPSWFGCERALGLHGLRQPRLLQRQRARGDRVVGHRRNPGRHAAGQGHQHPELVLSDELDVRRRSRLVLRDLGNQLRSLGHGRHHGGDEDGQSPGDRLRSTFPETASPCATPSFLPGGTA